MGSLLHGWLGYKETFLQVAFLWRLFLFRVSRHQLATCFKSEVAFYIVEYSGFLLVLQAV
jgi:hypothetical protein